MSALVVVLAAIVVFAAVVRPWYLAWGATREEVLGAMPGDDLVPAPKMKTTRALTIKAPPGKVWPWLVQVGYGRAGWYNHDWINCLLGAADYVGGHRSADRILPELQNLAVGDVIRVAPAVGWTVEELVPQRLLALSARVDFATGEPFAIGAPLPARYLNSSQVILLEPVGREATRLIVRDRLDFSLGGVGNILNWLLEPGFFIQESAFMRGIKRRAER